MTVFWVLVLLTGGPGVVVPGEFPSEAECSAAAKASTYYVCVRSQRGTL